MVAQAARTVPLERPRPGWAQHDPQALWDAACAALREATGQLERPERIAGVAAASVGEAFVAIDAAGQPVGPLIAWYDERPRAELDWLTREIGLERLHALCGLSPDPTFTLCKLLWLKANQPEVLERAVRWLNVTHYLAWRLCGEMTCDPTLASRTLAFDLRRRVWADDLIAEAGLSPELFAPIRPNGARLGRVTGESVALTGLPEGCAVGVGGHDHIVGALALGALGSGHPVQLARHRRGADGDAGAAERRARAAAARLQPGCGRGRAAALLRVRRLPDLGRLHRMVPRAVRRHRPCRR